MSKIIDLEQKVIHGCADVSFRLEALISIRRATAEEYALKLNTGETIYTTPKNAAAIFDIWTKDNEVIKIK